MSGCQNPIRLNQRTTANTGAVKLDERMPRKLAQSGDVSANDAWGNCQFDFSSTIF